tara:strand:- start:606 stop:1436 length:831 start_codon:yes stop_codon:yes gene_type:complete
MSLPGLTGLECRESFADLDWARVSDTTLRGEALRAELRAWPGRDFMKNVELFEADGALHARAAMLKAAKRGGLARTRIRRGFFRTVARLCNLEVWDLPSDGPAIPVAFSELTLARACELACAPILPEDLDSFGEYWRPPPGAIEELPAPITTWDELIAALIVVCAFTHADGLEQSVLGQRFGYDSIVSHDVMRDAALTAMLEIGRACTRSHRVDIAESAAQIARLCRRMPLPEKHQNRRAIAEREREVNARDLADDDGEGFVNVKVAPPDSGGMYD